MAALILTLPLTTGTATPEYDYLQTPDSVQITGQGRAPADLLPASAGRGCEVVVVVPARALSWHRAVLPEKTLRGLLSGRMETPRARSVLAGVLEDQLLDEPADLHFAVFARSGGSPDDAANAWIAVCNRNWLHGRLQTLEAAGHVVNRIVAEYTPVGAGAHLTFCDDLQPAQLVLCTAQGVSLLPLDAGMHMAHNHAPLSVQAQPPVMALAEKHFGGTVTLQTRAERLLQASHSAWNLAQLELSASAGGRIARRLGALWQQLTHAPQWRPARWSLLALVLVQIVGLNAVAWRQRALLDEQRNAIQSVLQQTFPEVRLVVDAPLQMQRSVEALARARGAGATTNLGDVMALVTPLVPPQTRLTGMELTDGRLLLKSADWNADTAQRVGDSLASQGLLARLQEGALLIEPKEPR